MVRIFCFLFAAGLLAAQSGEWLVTDTILGTPQYARAELKFEGEKITGRANNLTVEGTLRNGRVEFETRRPDGTTVTKRTGTLSGGEMNGQGARESTPFTWTARRIADRPPAPRTLRFEPKEFYRYFTSTIPPVLTIFPGDSVESWSVDAGGGDAQGVQRSVGGNPLTGPFYVEGAMPGDTLVVRFPRIRLNRDTAFSGSRVTPGALNAGYFASQKNVPNFDSSWTLDRQAGVARLTKPSEKLKDYRVPLRPMLGCVGVAPPQQLSFLSGYPGNFGGNMDYNQLVEGATVYLPVFHPGALLFIGDGHAAQGDGELTGNALETSMEWTFTVDLIRNRSAGAPRLENAEYLMASGIANSLPEALQSATTNLSRWLEDEYKLSANELGIVLGTAIRYDVAELVDPQIHVVAKIAKSVLGQIPK
jgi:acetamidase/formamidase